MNELIKTFTFSNEFISKYSESVEITFLFYIVVLTIFIIFKLKTFIDINEKIKFIRFKRLEDVLNNEILLNEQSASNITTYYKEQLAIESFKSIMGVKWNKEFQDEALKIHNNSSNITIDDIKLVNNHIELKKHKLAININFIEYLFIHLFAIFGFFILFVSIFLMILTFLKFGDIKSDSSTKEIFEHFLIYIARIGFCLVLFLSGLYLRKEYDKLKKAKEIDEHFSNFYNTYCKAFEKLPKSSYMFIFLIILIIILNFLLKLLS